MSYITTELQHLVATKKLIAIGQSTCPQVALLHVFEDEPRAILTYLPDPPDDYEAVSPDSDKLIRLEREIDLPPINAISSMTDNDLYATMVCGYTDDYDYTHEELQVVKQIDSEYIDRAIEALELV